MNSASRAARLRELMNRKPGRRDHAVKGYREVTGVDWMQLESPHSLDEIRLARAAGKRPFSFMKEKLPRFLGLDQHLALGVNIVWYPGFTHAVTWAALWDCCRTFRDAASPPGKVSSKAARTVRVARPLVGPEGEGADKQRELEERYLSPESLLAYGDA